MAEPRIDWTDANVAYTETAHALHAQRVTRRLARRYRGVHGDEIEDAFHLALLRLVAEPDRPPPGDAYRVLYDMAKDRLRTELRSRRRDKLRQEKHFRKREAESGGAVTPGAAGGPGPLDALAGAEEIAARAELARHYMDRLATTPEERRVLAAHLNGIVKPDEVAGVAGIDRALAVTILARIRKRLERLRASENPPDPPEQETP